MAATKAELQQEIQLLRKKLKEQEELLRQAAIKVEELQGARDASAEARKLRQQNSRKFELPPISTNNNSH